MVASSEGLGDKAILMIPSQIVTVDNLVQAI
jgi:hypothetical protein